MIRRRFSPLMGPVTSLDARNVPDDAAQDQLNVRNEDGALRVRRGYRNVLLPVANQTAVRHFGYYAGYDGSGAFLDRFIVLSKISGTVKPYEIGYAPTTDTYSRTEITKPAAVACNLEDSYWRAVGWEDDVYFFNAEADGAGGTDSDPMVRYTLGDTDSWTAVARPDPPTTLLSVNYAKNASGGAAYSIVRWAGFEAGDATYTGQASTATRQGASVRIEHTGTVGVAKTKIDLSAVDAGNQNLTYNDVQTFTLTVGTPGSFQIDPFSVRCYLENSGGTETELSVTQVPEYDGNGDVVRVSCYAKFQSKTRATWATTRYLSVEYETTQTTGTPADTYLTLSPVTLGGIVDWGTAGSEAGAAPLRVGYAFYDSTTGYESNIGGIVDLSLVSLRGSPWPAYPELFLGTIPVLTSTTSGGADKVRIYAARRVRSEGRDRTPQWSKWRRVTEQDDTDTTYTYETTADSFETLSEYFLGSLRHQGILCAGRFKGHMVWGYKGGASNVRHSRVGEPLLLTEETADGLDIDTEDPDVFGPATFSLSSDVSDDPVGFVEMGDVLVILGEKGVYAQVGDTPKGMTPPRAVPGAPGCWNYESFARWRDDAGNAAVVYVSRDFQSLWMLQVNSGFDGENGFRVFELTAPVRGLVYSHLLGSSAVPNPERCAVFVEPWTDGLWSFYTQRALVLRRPSLVDGRRQWEPYTYGLADNADTWIKAAVSATRGVFVVRIDGQVDQFERAVMPSSSDPSAFPETQRVVEIAGAGYAPSSTDTGSDYVTFSDFREWGTGTPVTVSATGGGLTAGTTYYLRRRADGLSYHFHTSYADAVAGSSTVNLTGSVTATVTPLGRDDGRAVDSSIYWRGKRFLDRRRRAVRVMREAETLTDAHTVTVRDEDGSTTRSWASGRQWVSLGLGVKGRSIDYQINLPEGSGAVYALEVEETPIGRGLNR